MKPKFVPEGVKDLLSRECEYKEKVIGQLKNLYKSYGYRQIATPTFEYYDLFTSIKNSVDKDKTLKMIDEHGKILVLRPDVTTPIVRMVASNYENFVGQLKFTYCMNVFRVNDEQNAQKREFTQMGVELLGEKSIYSDPEVIALAIKSLKTLGLKDFQLEIGQSEYIEGLLFSIENKEEIKKIIANRNIIELNAVVDKMDVDNDIKEAIKKVPTLYGDVNSVLKEAMVCNDLMADAIRSIKTTYEILKMQGLHEHLSMDLCMIQDINYYKGIVFKGYVNNFGKPVLSGGRYDQLSKEYASVCATGFGVNIDELIHVLDENNLKNDFACFTDYLVVGTDVYKVFRKCDQLRGEGYVVESFIGTDYKETKAQRNVKQVLDLNKGEADGNN